MFAWHFAKDLIHGDVILLVTEQQEATFDKSKVQKLVGQWKAGGYSVITTADLELGSRAWAVIGYVCQHDHKAPV